MTTKNHAGKTGAGLNRRAFGKTAIAAAALTGIAPFNIVRAQAAKLKIGVINSTSGPLAGIGQQIQRGYEIAIPIMKQLGYADIEYIYADSESKVDSARAHAERLTGAGVQALSGAFDSGQTTAIAQVAEQKRVPFVINISAADAITEQGFKYTFRGFPTSTYISRGAFALQKEIFASTGKAPKKVVVLHVNDTFGVGQAASVKALAGSQGMPYEIVDYIPYDLRAPDLSGEVAKAKATGADGLWMISRLNDAMIVTRELVKQRFNPMGIFSTGPGWYEDQYLKTMGKNGDFVTSFIPWFNPKKPVSQLLIAEWKKKYPDVSMDSNIHYTVEAVLTICDAAKRAGTTDTEILTQAIRTSNMTNNISLAPVIAFNAKGQNEQAGIACVQNLNQALKVVAPATAAEAKVVFPIPPFTKRA